LNNLQIVARKTGGRIELPLAITQSVIPAFAGMTAVGVVVFVY